MDVSDILEIERNGGTEPINILKGERSKAAGVGGPSKRKSKTGDERPPGAFPFKKPEGMHREVFALLYKDGKDGPPIMPTEHIANISKSEGYKQVKVKLGLRKVRPWRWMPFHNAGRADNFMLSHWRRAVDADKEYQFAGFNKSVHVPVYTDAEYQQHLRMDGWTKPETDHLFALCRRFDLRFIIVHDHWDRALYSKPRSVEDLKERYYGIHNQLAKVRAPAGQEPKLKVFDAEHERKRKEQLRKQYDRTTEQLEEEQQLLEELRKIDIRKKEREKKTQDLQQLITGNQGRKSDTPSNKQQGGGPGPGRPGRGPGRKKVTNRLPTVAGGAREAGIPPGTPTLESAGIKFPEIKSSGTSLRSQRMKLPAAVGTKKTKAIEQLLTELHIELRPMPTEEICQNFNELRSDMVLLYELKMALASYEFELQTLKHQYEALQPEGHKIELPPGLGGNGAGSSTPTAGPAAPPAAGKQSSVNVVGPEGGTELGSTPKKAISEMIDVGGTPVTPSRKRKAALEQGNLLRKLKKN